MSEYAPTPKLWKPRLWPWLIAFAVWLALSLVHLFAAVQITSVVISTNRPAFDFSAATPLGSVPTAAYWHSSNDCHSVTITFTGDPGVYDLQWNGAIGTPRPLANGIEGHAFCNVYPPITNTAGTVTVTYPAKPSPAGYWRLKKRL